jgi:hypothetical protein
VLVLGSLEPPLEAIDVFAGRPHAPFGLLLERVQSVHGSGQFHAIHEAKRAPPVDHHDLEDPRSSEAPEWLRRGMFAALLGLVQGEPHYILHYLGKSAQVVSAAGYPKEWLDRIFSLLLSSFTTHLAILSMEGRLHPDRLTR